MTSRLRLLALLSGRAARVFRSTQQPQCARRLHSTSWSTPHHHCRWMILAVSAGVTSFAAFGSSRGAHLSPDCAPSAPLPSALSTAVDHANHAVLDSAGDGGFLHRFFHATTMVIRCAVVSIVLFPASLLFILNRISNGYIVCELSVARVLTSSLQLLGPAAIKFGQWASSRDDLFPPVVTRELGRLQSNADPHALEHTLSEIEALLQHFRSVDPKHANVRLEDIHATPIGSGSIAQVHRARLVGLDPNADVNVVVKVLHPSVREQLILDTQIFCGLAWLASLLPKSWTFGAEAAAAQFKDHLLAQLDLSVEHSNLQRFRANFSSDSTVVFPAVFNHLCTGSCLIETWEEGEGLRDFFLRIDRASQQQSHSTQTSSLQMPLQPSTSDLLDRMSAGEIHQLSRELGVAGASAFLKMLVRDNFVHADLHPGNMIVRLELFKGHLRHKLVLCDAGLVGEMTPAASLNFIELFHAVLRGDGRDAGLQMIRHAPRQECADPEEFASGVARVVDRVMSSGFQLKLTSVSGILTEMFSLAREHRVQIDGAYATTAVALGILEGTGRRLNSSLDLFKLAFPLVIEVRAKKLLQMI